MNVPGMIFARGQLKLKARHGVRGTKLSDKLFNGIGVVTEAFAKLTVTPRSMGSPMGSFVG